MKMRMLRTARPLALYVRTARVIGTIHQAGSFPIWTSSFYPIRTCASHALSTTKASAAVTRSEFTSHLEAVGLDRETLHQLYAHSKENNANNPQERCSYPLAVALSGGADSMALMLLLNELLDEERITTPLLAITVDHALRTESGDEARFVGEIASRQWGVDHVIQQCDWDRDTRNGAPRKSKLQEEARAYRYELLAQACRQYGVKCLLVAHNLGDQLETVLFRLGRASGINGLTGIAPKSFLVGEEGDDDAVELVRPLLGVSKASLKSTCERFQQPWVEDPSNESLLFDRIRIRKALQSIEESANGHEDIAALLEFQRVAERAKREFKTRENELLDKHTIVQESDYVVLSAALLSDARCFDELAMRILSTLVRRIGGRDTPPRLSSLQGLLHDLRTLGSGKKVTLSGCCITKKNRSQELHFQPERPNTRRFVDPVRSTVETLI